MQLQSLKENETAPKSTCKQNRSNQILKKILKKMAALKIR
jgi:hypothetical protein